MSRLELIGVSDGTLRSASGSFEPACTVATGDDAGALATLARVASGVAPARGSVLLDGRPLATSAPVRRRVASALAQEALPPARDLGHAVGRVLAARGDARSSASVLEPFGLAGWSRKQPDALDRDELRSVALALALAHENADLVVLYEPLSTSSLDASLVRERIAEAVAREAIVLVATASLILAQSFGGPHVAVVGGVLQPAASAA